MSENENQEQAAVQEEKGAAHEKKHHGFSSKLGFVLAAAGSAVGLGNLWRFPYLAARHGGIFILFYIAFAVTFGFALLILEIAIGRKTGKDVVGAFGELNKKTKWFGFFSLVVPVIIVPYYCVIGGWVLKYLVSYMNGMGATGALTGDFFATFISGSWEPLIYFLIFAAMTFVVVVLGVQKGIEKVSKILMPILAILAVVLAVFVLCQPNAWKGLSYIFVPDFGKFSGEMLLDALGQLFYSMSLAMCIMITYGSYMKKDANIQKSGRQISVCDTSFAIVASLIIIPAIFAFSANPDGDLASSGPSLMFVVLPNVFGALSSLGFGVLNGIQLNGKTILDMFDFISNSVLMPLVAIGTCVIVGYFTNVRLITEEIGLKEKSAREKYFKIMIRFVAPVCLIAILVSGLMSAF